MITVNTIGYYCSKDITAISKSIKGTNKPILAFKVLAAGRTPPEEGLKAFPEEVEENANRIRRYT